MRTQIDDEIHEIIIKVLIDSLYLDGSQDDRLYE